jgi:hypothetical protein
MFKLCALVNGSNYNSCWAWYLEQEQECVRYGRYRSLHPDMITVPVGTGTQVH